jgi:hypothetical protein
MCTRNAFLLENSYSAMRAERNGATVHEPSSNLDLRHHFNPLKGSVTADGEPCALPQRRRFRPRAAVILEPRFPRTRQ